MAFKNTSEQQDAVKLLQRSLERGRLGHAYLFTGSEITVLEEAAANLAKTLNCENPPPGPGRDCCDECLSCRKIDQGNHPDVQWVRPESKSRVITIDQMRALMKTVHLKPTQARYKVSVIVAADRLNDQSANAFLKTLEEPPADSILILLSGEPQRLLETILSRCLRLNFSGENIRLQDPEFLGWLAEFSETAAGGSRSLLGRYRLLSVLLRRLNAVKESIQETLNAKSPIEQYEDVEAKMREKWEVELAAAIEAEYRHQRTDLLAGLQCWFRDIWLGTLRLGDDLMAFPQLAPQAQAVADRISSEDALHNLQQLETTQRLLFTNVQEALALEVGLLKLKL